MYFFTSDTHFGHIRILEYCKRPFANITEHDEALINNWNSIVKDGDKVYHLGDFSFSRRSKSEWILSRLNGEKFLLHGNHDKKNRWPREETGLYTDLGDYHKLTIQDKTLERGKIEIILCHYAFEVWDKRHWGSWHLFAHSHGTLPSRDDQMRLDVGVDVHGYTPISYEQVKLIMSKKTFKPIKRKKGERDEEAR